PWCARTWPGTKRLVGYVVLPPDAAWEPEALRRQLASRLPEYLVPSALLRLEALPLTPSGKLARRQLPAPDADSLRGEAPFIAPRTRWSRRWRTCSRRCWECPG
ncbi:AMP-binding enzyme, partial [Corallococcus sp. 4LFB]|uniref:AMP-binding enzyme n=1 Tax=Corallococcus sp. 4LFB TaxID=3383249 RepID=UPI0039760EF0